VTSSGLLQIALYLVVLVALVKPLGGFMARVYEGERTWLSRVLGPVERLIYRSAAVDPAEDQNWKQYAFAALLFNAVGFAFVYMLQRAQGLLPLNPQGFGAVSPDSAFNTAISFASNTNWQGYGGESTMSYLTQMLGLGVQNFVSAAGGMAVLIALIRGFARRQATGLGNFWVDLTRSTLYILLPLSSLLAIVLVSQGVVQNFAPYRSVSLLEPVTIEIAATDPAGRAITQQQVITEQTIAARPRGESQIAIKQLGTNGGGFFNVNSAHPFENPTPLSNFLELLSPSC
jgi:K+-transporting ATPase ATPase A chain